MYRAVTFLFLIIKNIVVLSSDTLTALVLIFLTLCGS